MESLQIFQYQNNSVTFRRENGQLYANATEMAKPFGKLSKDWLSLKSTNEFLETLHAERGIVLSELIIISKGGLSNQQGTWMHEDVALEFSRWLNPKFAIWCNARIKELLTIGMTATPEKLEEMIMNPDVIIGLATKLKEERQRAEMLEQKAKVLQHTVIEQQPKVEYYDEVLQSQSLIPTTAIAALLGMSAMTLNKKLKEMGIQWRVHGRWVLRSKYAGCGYAKDRTVPYQTDADGTVQTSTLMYWTEKGKRFILEKFKELKAA